MGQVLLYLRVNAPELSVAVDQIRVPICS
jgi:hypothetical protein